MMRSDTANSTVHPDRHGDNGVVIWEDRRP